MQACRIFQVSFNTAVVTATGVDTNGPYYHQATSKTRDRTVFFCHSVRARPCGVQVAVVSLVCASVKVSNNSDVLLWFDTHAQGYVNNTGPSCNRLRFLFSGFKWRRKTARQRQNLPGKKLDNSILKEGV